MFLYCEGTRGSFTWKPPCGGEKAAQLIGQPLDTACSAQELLGHDLSCLLQLSGQPAPAPLRLASGLGVWMQAHLQTSHGLGSHLDTSSVEDQASPATTEATPVAEAQPLATLREHSAQLIPETLGQHGRNGCHGWRSSARSG